MTRMETFLAEYFASPGPHKLELGAGENGKPGWITTDLLEHPNPNGTYTIGVDVTRSFPFADGCFDVIYAEHMIEHIPLNSGISMLRECHRVLKTGGTVRIVTPSLGFMLRVMSYDQGALERSYMNWSVRTFVPDAPIVSNAVFLNNFVRNWGHQFIYDRATLLTAFQTAGFSAIRELPINKSDVSVLAGLESITRLPPGFLELESMVFEADKAGS